MAARNDKVAQKSSVAFFVALFLLLLLSASVCSRISYLFSPLVFDVSSSSGGGGYVAVVVVDVVRIRNSRAEKQTRR